MTVDSRNQDGLKINIHLFLDSLQLCLHWQRLAEQKGDAVLQSSGGSYSLIFTGLQRHQQLQLSVCCC